MAVLAQILQALPAIASYGFLQRSTNIAPVANGVVPLDVATVVGPDMTFSGSGVGLTANTAGRYLMIGGGASTVLASTSGGYVVNVQRGGSTVGMQGETRGPAYANALTLAKNPTVIISATVGQTFRLSNTSANAAWTYNALRCWLFVARLT